MSTSGSSSSKRCNGSPTVLGARMYGWIGWSRLLSGQSFWVVGYSGDSHTFLDFQYVEKLRTGIGAWASVLTHLGGRAAIRSSTIGAHVDFWFPRYIEKRNNALLLNRFVTVLCGVESDAAKSVSLSGLFWWSVEYDMMDLKICTFGKGFSFWWSQAYVETSSCIQEDLIISWIMQFDSVSAFKVMLQNYHDQSTKSQFTSHVFHRRQWFRIAAT